MSAKVEPSMQRVRDSSRMTKIAEALGITRQAPYLWRRVPAEHVQVVAKVTGIKPYELRPDIFPPPRRRRNGNRP